MRNTLIAAIDPETQELEPIAAVTCTTALAIAPKWCYYTSLWFGGWNLYAIDGGKALLLETYEEERGAVWIRDHILANIRANAEIIVV